MSYILSGINFGASAVNTYFAFASYPETIGAFNAAAAVFCFGIGVLLAAQVAARN